MEKPIHARDRRLSPGAIGSAFNGSFETNTAVLIQQHHFDEPEEKLLKPRVIVTCFGKES
jgi:hypothetical protein